ncbi:outer membrane beta-barrel protein [Mangrovibacterium lignilyticum]|uniref:outer membrane beta-barrel protein n=1 Tax=Mangrovibacterium lignilyticum TaxID=2668052 RepID=UPI0013D3930D|nr:outer membrane beta-barrel protein [Mangrovibacterium lignilyticum]
MKRFIGLATIMLLVFTLHAQDTKLGVRVGYQNTRMSVDGDKVGDTGNSFYLNVYKDSKIIPFLFFHSGIQYSQAKAGFDNGDYRINYLGAPIGLKAKVGPLYGLAGATFNVKLSDDNSPTGESAKWYDTNTFVGLGFSFLMLNVEGRYAWGLTDINQGIHNNAFQIGLGLRF